MKVIGSAKKRKHEKNLADNRDSITTVRIGSAAGIDGPRVYLAKGKTIEHRSMINSEIFCENYGAPAGSCVQMTPSAYMTDEAWRSCVPIICKGIRQMEGIRDHPDWWVVFSLDGYGSHLDSEALQAFSEHKILVIKEEGDTSQVCQAYDQEVAKEDKRITRELLEGYKFNVAHMINQWELIIIINEALNKVEKGDAWRNSFIRVNMCPSKRVRFTVWIEK